MVMGAKVVDDLVALAIADGIKAPVAVLKAVSVWIATKAYPQIRENAVADVATALTVLHGAAAAWRR